MGRAKDLHCLRQDPVKFGTHALQHIQAHLHVSHPQANVAQQPLPAQRVQFRQRLV
jgi:hypothetical protein